MLSLVRAVSLPRFGLHHLYLLLRALDRSKVLDCLYAELHRRIGVAAD